MDIAKARPCALPEIIARPPKIGQLPPCGERERRATRTGDLIRSGDVTGVLTGSFVFFLYYCLTFGSACRSFHLYQTGLFDRRSPSRISNVSLPLRFYHRRRFVFHFVFLFVPIRL